MSVPQTIPAHRRFGALRAPDVIGATVLTVLSLAMALRPIALWTTSLVPPTALMSGIRTPALPPRLGVPLGDGTSFGWWLIETLAAVVFIAGYWYWTHYGTSAVRSRGHAFRRAWLAVVVALVAANIVRATSTSLLSGDGLLSYALMLGGNVAVSMAAAAIMGVVVGAICALALGPVR